MEKLNESIYGMYQRWSSGENGQRKEDVHDYVDLGLPSGLMWATCNLGADTPTQFGDYYQWGGIEPTETGKKEECPYYDSKKETYTKYNKEDGLTVLEPKDDAVHIAWGGKWRMPTKEEIEELIKNTKNKWVENYLDSGVNGILFTAENGNELFIPAAGYYSYTLNYRGVIVYLWSSSLVDRYHNYNAYCLNCFDGHVFTYISDRYNGYSVRGVFEK